MFQESETVKLQFRQPKTWCQKTRTENFLETYSHELTGQSAVFHLQSSFLYLPGVPHRGGVTTQFQDYMKALIRCLLCPRLVPRNCHFAHTGAGCLSFRSLSAPPPPWPFSLPTEMPSFSSLKPSQLITPWCDHSLESQKFIAGEDLRNKPPCPLGL